MKYAPPVEPKGEGHEVVTIDSSHLKGLDQNIDTLACLGQTLYTIKLYVQTNSFKTIFLATCSGYIIKTQMDANCF